MRAADIVDDFIDAHGTGHFTRTDLAVWAGWSDDEASTALQLHRLANAATPDGTGGMTMPGTPTRHVLERTGMGPSVRWRKSAPVDHGTMSRRAVLENLDRIKTDLNVRAREASRRDPVEAALYLHDATFIAAGISLLEAAIAARP